MPAPGTALHVLFHTLWSKAVGTPGYIKQEWLDFEDKLNGEAKQQESGRAEGIEATHAAYALHIKDYPEWDCEGGCQFGQNLLDFRNKVRNENVS